MEATEANLLALPLENGGLPHQLRLTRPLGVDAIRRTNLCMTVLEHPAATNGMGFFNGLTQLHQIVAILITEGDNTHTRLDQFIRAIPNNRNRALYNSLHRNDNAKIVFQESQLGLITNFIHLRASIRLPERLGPRTGPESAGAPGGAVPMGREPAGQYDQAFCARKMQAEDMKNTKTFLQQGPLMAAGIEKFDLWREDIVRATRLVNLTERAHWAMINRLIETRMDNNI